MGAFIVVVLGGLGMVGLSAYEKWQTRPQAVTALKGISLGEKLTDAALRQEPFKPKPTDEKSKYESDGSERYLGPDEKRTALFVRDGRIEVIFYVCTSTSDYTALNGIGCAASGDEVLSRFGKAVRVQCEKKIVDGEEPVRVYDVPEYGVRYLLSRNKVDGFMISAGLALLTGGNWDVCP